MKIIVCVKQVPDTNVFIKVREGGDGIVTEGLAYVVNPYEEYAVEEALRIKEKFGGEVTVITLGPDRVVEAIRTCLAMGVDHAIHLPESDDELDPLATARVLTEAIKKLDYDIILCGKHAVDDGASQVGPALAEYLDLPQVTFVRKIEIAEDGKSAIAHREVEGGTQVVKSSLPAVFTAEKDLNEPRYPTLKGMMAAKRIQIQILNHKDLGLHSLKSKSRRLKLLPPPERPPGKMLQGEPEEIVKELVRLLRDEAKVI
ncbi:electron transfer flavoprotein subunit beta/FixA family protein [candidate division TA06 bacterium]|nr:electron transfer flavoprotein subunit beta/FixA family protein [candidate division TA06 bacterium]